MAAPFALQIGCADFVRTIDWTPGFRARIEFLEIDMSGPMIGKVAGFIGERDPASMWGEVVRRRLIAAEIDEHAVAFENFGVALYEGRLPGIDDERQSSANDLDDVPWFGGAQLIDGPAMSK